MKYPLFRRISLLLQAIENCKAKPENEYWAMHHEEEIEGLVKNHMPSGAGFDNGTKLDFDASTPEKLVFNTSFHHMDQHGHYDRWTEHVVTVKPSLQHLFELRISGKNYKEIKDHIYECFHQDLGKEDYH